jgi:chorismate mutase
MEQQAEWLRAQVVAYAKAETVGDEAREKEILERLSEAWDLREEGEIVE